MPKQLTITTTYNSDTRLLQSVASLVGFIAISPDEVISKTEASTVTLFTKEVILPTDSQAIVQSVARLLISVNTELASYAAAAANLEAADKILASSIDPVTTFNDALNPPEPTP